MAACPYCFTETERPWGLVRGRTALACDGCGVSFFPRPIETSADYRQYYPYLEGFDRARFAWELGIRRGKYRYQLREIRRFRPDSHRIVDIGAGPGYLCKVAMEEGWEAIGIEASQPAVDAGRREYGVRYETLDAVGAASQDAISCHHVLEHIEEPAGFLAKVRAKLTDDGILVVHVPHQEPLTCLLRTALERLVRSDNGQWGRRIDAKGFVRTLANALGDNAGRLVGRGDWVIGHFRAI